MDIRYDIQNFYWNKEHNTFYAAAWNLMPIMPDGSSHQDLFPTGKQQFIIYNYKTDGFRRFRYVDEIEKTYDAEEYEIIEKNWHFISEDGIHCMIAVSHEARPWGPGEPCGYEVVTDKNL